MSNVRVFRAIVGLVAFLAVLPALATEPTLREIMQGLRDDLVAMTDALLLQDPEAVSDAAAGIAAHAPISASERKIIASELGPAMAHFARLDERVHTLSLSIAEAAAERDQARVLTDYRQMLAACLGCHNAYKTRVSSALTAAGSKAGERQPR